MTGRGRLHGEEGKACGHQAGFTLIEMLVVLVLIALMSALMVGTTRQMRTWQLMEHRALRQAELDTLADFMAAEIGGALDFPMLHVSLDTPMSLVGGPDQVQFVAVLKTGFSSRRLVEAEYRLDRSGTPSILKRLTWPHRPPRGGAPSAQIEELLRGVDSIRFRYLIRTDQEAHVWIDEWRNSGGLPEAVQIELTSRTGNAGIEARRVAVLAH